MNILLTAINAKYIHSNLAVYSLRACAGEYRDAVELAEYTINNQKDYILEELYKRKPDVLCFRAIYGILIMLLILHASIKSFVRQCRYGLEALRCLTRWRHFCGKIHT